MKKVKVIFLALLIIFLVPTSSFASSISPQGGNGQWDLIGAEYWPNISTTPKSSSIYKSTGGDFRVCVDFSNSSATATIDFWEYDPNNPDDFIGWTSSNVEDGECVQRNVEGELDGGNGAEIYVRLYYATAPSSVNLFFYD